MNEIDLLEQKAIDTALTLRWNEAAEWNKKILKLDKHNLSALLRLGFIYLQINQLKEAKKYYKTVLKIQSGHLLAQENMEKIQILEETKGKKQKPKNFNFNPNLFLEITGKTKAVVLINPGQKNILAQLTIGEEIYLKPKSRKIEIRTKSNEYLGSLPDDLSKRLLLFIKAGSAYSCFIKEVSISRVVVFIREDKKGKKVAKYSSFPKNTQTHLAKITAADEEQHAEGEEDEVIESDLEKLAEVLTHEEKEFIPYQKDEEEDEENIEE